MARYEDIARAFVDGKQVPASAKTLSGRRRLYQDVLYLDPTSSDASRALFSYGPHFPVVIEGEDFSSFFVNETRYFPSTHEREREGWVESPYHPRTKQRSSPTTQRQIDEVKSALRRAGYVEWANPARSMLFHTPHGDETYQFSEWRRL